MFINPIRLKSLVLLCLLFGLASCDKDQAKSLHEHDHSAGGVGEHCESSTCALDRIYELKGKRFLYTGPDSSQHFIITHWELQDDRLRDHGLSREAFPALITPSYRSLEDLRVSYPDNMQMIVVKGKTETRAYPYSLMTFHEVINDEIDGIPYMVGYCVLADFAAVYHREICDKVLTFGVSGYTYLNQRLEEDEVQAFILWDRETESLWNPLDDIGVSRHLKNVPMKKLSAAQWELLSFKDMKQRFPTVKVLASGQNMTPPSNWPELNCTDLSCCN